MPIKPMPIKSMLISQYDNTNQDDMPSTHLANNDVLSNAIPPDDKQHSDGKLAAIDIGSNSFHLAVARLDFGEVRKVVSLSDKVQLAGGLDDNNRLSDEIMARGVRCLTQFANYLEGIDHRFIRVVATNALRKAVNADDFVHRANAVLPVPIEIISGREEARLIYLGVSHTNASAEQRLVIDIGGGSTEFIIGQGFEPILAESLQMGCVAFTKKFFADGKINQQSINQAMNATQNELFAIAKRYKKTGWSHVMGSSGTIKAVFLAIQELDFGESITLEGVEKLLAYLIDVGDSDNMALLSVKSHRERVFAAGVAELFAIMQGLGIDKMDYSDGALREGVLYDMLGRQTHEDVQGRSVQAIAERYSVSHKQATLVADTCWRFFKDNQSALGLDDGDGDLLYFAAQLHEVGLAVSHSNYHEHSSYLLKHADMFGFSRSEQEKLSLMARFHRRKLKAEQLDEVKRLGGQKLVYLCLLLRLAVLAHQSRSRHSARLNLMVEQDKWRVHIGEGNHQTAIGYQLFADSSQFAKWGIKLLATAN